MGSVWACLSSKTHLTCCSIISLLGALFYGILFLVITYQYEYVAFHITKYDETRWACLLTLFFYLAWFIGTLVCVSRMGTGAPRIPNRYQQFNDEEPAKSTSPVNNSQYLKQRE